MNTEAFFFIYVSTLPHLPAAMLALVASREIRVRLSLYLVGNKVEFRERFLVGSRF